MENYFVCVTTKRAKAMAEDAVKQAGIDTKVYDLGIGVIRAGVSAYNLFAKHNGGTMVLVGGCGSLAKEVGECGEVSFVDGYDPAVGENIVHDLSSNMLGNRNVFSVETVERFVNRYDGDSDVVDMELAAICYAAKRWNKKGKGKADVMSALVVTDELDKRQSQEFDFMGEAVVGFFTTYLSDLKGMIDLEVQASKDCENCDCYDKDEDERDGCCSCYPDGCPCGAEDEDDCEADDEPIGDTYVADVTMED